MCFFPLEAEVCFCSGDFYWQSFIELLLHFHYKINQLGFKKGGGGQWCGQYSGLNEMSPIILGIKYLVPVGGDVWAV